MKFLLSLTLMVIISQFSLADDAITVFDIEENNMLFPIFDMIAEQMYSYHKVNIPRLGAIYSELLRDNSNYFEIHDTQPYEDYKTAIEKLLKSVELYENDDEYNCEAQRTVQIDLRAAGKAKPDDDVLAAVITKLIAKRMDSNKPKEILNEINEQIVKLLKDFVENLDEDELQKKNYAELYELAENVLQASDEKLKFKSIFDFMTAAKTHLNMTSPNKTNCKYDESNFDEYMRTISFKLVNVDKFKN